MFKTLDNIYSYYVCIYHVYINVMKTNTYCQGFFSCKCKICDPNVLLYKFLKANTFITVL